MQQELINARTNQGKSALHEACTTLMASENRSTVHFIRTINLDVVLALLESGADCATVDNEGDRYVQKMSISKLKVCKLLTTIIDCNYRLL